MAKAAVRPSRKKAKMGKLKPYGYRPPGFYRAGKRDDARAAALYWARKRRREMVRGYETGSVMTPVPLISGTGTVI